ncbi:MAG: low molecular weight protein arginine phosphatase [Myxococcota bacterium]|nr:low molecular weight protein arginine phosphatase [Myxococcota bacterium]
MSTNILFVCTGNICRSPLAEVIARAYADERGRLVSVASASVLGLDGPPAHKHSIKVASEIGLNLHDHRAQPVTEELIDWADYILGMEIQHAAKLRGTFPQADEKIMLLGNFGGVHEIADPLGKWRPRFRSCRDLIQDCVHTFIDRLPKER